MPTSGNKNNSVGETLRHWRHVRKMSQMALALDVEISPKHLSFVETGKARPSRALILRIANSLNLSLRQRNLLLRAGGYPVEFSNMPFDVTEMSLVRDALHHLLVNHEPYPALVIDTAYDILMTNSGFERIVTLYAGADALQKYSNLYQLIFAEDGLRFYFKDWPLIERFLLARLLEEALSTQNEQLKALYEDMRALKSSDEPTNFQTGSNIPVLNFTLQKDNIKVTFFSTVTTFGTPLDVTVQELRIESLFPANEETKQLFHTAT
ncbi:MAG: helix-turn-helix domain-containing protein [Chloroflexota bacterium]